MKITLKLLCLFFVVQLQAQEIFDLPFDNIAISEHYLNFVNIEEKTFFKANLSSETINEKFSLEFSVSDYAIRKSDYLNTSKLIQPTFQEPETLIKGLKNQRYEAIVPKYRREGTERLTALQLFNHNQFVFIEYEKREELNEWKTDEWKVKNATFLQFCFLRLTNGSYIIALFDYSVFKGYIIPTEEEIIVWYDGYEYEYSGLKNTSLDLTKYFDFEDYYEVKTVDGKQQIYDLFFDEKLVDLESDELWFECLMKNKAALDKMEEPNEYTVFDIPVEYLRIKEERLHFSSIDTWRKKGYLKDYHINLEQTRSYASEVMVSESRSVKQDTLNLNDNIDYLKVESPQELLQMVEGKRFERPLERGGLVIFQKYNNFFVRTYSLKHHEPAKGGIWEAAFYDYCFLRLKDGSHILALIDDFDIEAYFIPTKKGGIIVENNRNTFAYAGNAYDFDGLDARFEIDKHYFTVPMENNFLLKSHPFGGQALETAFDTIWFGLDSYVIGQKDNEIWIFDKAMQPVNTEKIEAAFEANRVVIQVIQNDSVKWLTRNSVFHDENPKTSFGVCGTVMYADRRIEEKNGIFYQIKKASYPGGDPSFDSLAIVSNTRITRLNYLNNEITHSYSGNSNLFSVYRFPYDYYAFESPKTKGIIQIINVRDSIRNTIRKTNTYRMKKYINQDSLKQAIAAVPPQFRSEILLEGDFQAIETFGYNHPIRFKKNDLYGYFPFHKKAKYKRLEAYQQYFAVFEYPDGRKGWIDTEGREYFMD